MTRIREQFLMQDSSVQHDKKHIYSTSDIIQCLSVSTTLFNDGTFTMAPTVFTHLLCIMHC